MAERSTGSVVDCELCIVGAGYAALNGLNAAAKYLAPGARVVIIERRDGFGGQWLDQYDFVRLHQPYEMFTAGDQKWRLPGRERSYLATRREILDHLATVPARSAGHLEIDARFGHEYLGHRVEGERVLIEARPVEGGPVTRIRAARMLDGTGIDIEILKPFEVSSRRVRSVAVADPVLTTPEFLESDAPVVLIGSGKTAMDTARWLAASSGPRRKLTVITGSGMWFFWRDEAYPTGLARYTRGKPTNDVFLRMCELFDGENEQAVFDALERERTIIKVFDEAANCRYGLLSQGERDEILARVDEVLPGHLVDVDGLRMTIRHRGVERPVDVEEGTWLINCTAHLLDRVHRPILSGGGLVCAPQTCLGFSGTSAYFVTHAWYRDTLPEVADGLFRCRLDVEPKLRFTPQAGLMIMANLALVTSKLPLSVVARFEGDFNKWYPLVRQVPSTLRLLTRQKQIIAKAERLLPMRFSDAA